MVSGEWLLSAKLRELDEQYGRLHQRLARCQQADREQLEQALNLENAAREVDFLEAQCAADGFWDNPEKSQRVLQKLKQEPPTHKPAPKKKREQER